MRISLFNVLSKKKKNVILERGQILNSKTSKTQPPTSLCPACVQLAGRFAANSTFAGATINLSVYNITSWHCRFFGVLHKTTMTAWTGQAKQKPTSSMRGLLHHPLFIHCPGLSSTFVLLLYFTIFDIVILYLVLSAFSTNHKAHKDGCCEQAGEEGGEEPLDHTNNGQLRKFRIMGHTHGLQ